MQLTKSVLDLMEESYCDQFNYKQLTNKQLYLVLLFYKFLKLVSAFKDKCYPAGQKDILIESCLIILRILRKVLIHLVENLPEQLMNIFKDIFLCKITSNINNLNLYSLKKVSVIIFCFSTYLFLSNHQSYYGEMKSLNEAKKNFCLLYFLPTYYWHLLISKGENSLIRLFFSENVTTIFVNYNKTIRQEILEAIKEVLEPFLKKFNEYESIGKCESFVFIKVI